jgi:hypothetical protein
VPRRAQHEEATTVASTETGARVIDGITYVPAASNPTSATLSGPVANGVMTLSPDTFEAESASAMRYACSAHPHEVTRGGKVLSGFSANGMFGPQGHLVLQHKYTPEAAEAARPTA